MTSRLPAYLDPRIALIFLFGLTASAVMVRPIPILGQLAGAVSATPAEMGWVLGLIGLPGLIAPFIGVVADRYGIRNVLLFAGILGALASLIPVVASGVDHLIAGRLLEGLMFSCITTTGPALIMRLASGKEQVTAMTIWATTGPIGMAFGLYAGGIAATTDWHMLFILFSCLLAALSLTAWSVLPGREATSESGMGMAAIFRALANGYKQPAVLRLSFTGLFLVGAGLAFNALYPLSAAAQGWSTPYTAKIMALGTLMTIPGSFLAGAVIARQVSSRLLMAVIAIGMGLCGIVMFGMSAGDAALLVALFLWFVGYGAALVAMLTILPKVAQADAEGQAVGTLNQMMALGKTLMPPLWMSLWLTGAGLYVTVAIILILLAMAAVYPRAKSPA